MIVAGPGSGKTRTLTQRIVHLVAERGVAGEHCLAITFTRRAAAEMRERLRDEPRRARQATIAVHTFHSLGLSMLREHANAAGLQRGFRVAGEAERVAALAAALDLPQPRAQSLMRAISKAERTATAPSGEVAEARAAYQKVLAVNNWIDFDDLVGLAVRLLENNPDIAALYRERFRFVSVDEFQDVDALQYRLLTLLAPPPGGNLCVIGDPHQAIYGFRGADASCFERFRSDYPGAATVALKRNYRSSGTIVAASSQIIAENQTRRTSRSPKSCATCTSASPSTQRRASAPRPSSSSRRSSRRSAGTASSRSTAAAPAAKARRFRFADFAVLYRTEAQAAALDRSLGPFGHSVPQAFPRPAWRGAGRARAARCFRHRAPDRIMISWRASEARRGGSLLKKTKRPPSNSPCNGSLPLAETCGGDQARFLDAVALASDADFWDPRADGVALLDAARRKRPGIRLRLHRRPRGRRAAAALGQGGERTTKWPRSAGCSTSA